MAGDAFSQQPKLPATQLRPIRRRMMSGYCRSCYRDVSADDVLCRACAERTTLRFHHSRIAVLLGVIGLPVLLTGVLNLNQRMCLIGAGISAAALLLHLILSLR